MVPLLSLWAPVLVAAVLVFIASSIIHMLLKYHNSDYRPLPDEVSFRSAVGPQAIPPGDYMVPYCGPDGMGDPEYHAKLEEGPVVVMSVLPNQMFAMGKSMLQWFAYCLLVGVFAGYVAAITLPPGSDYMVVFRLTGTVAFAGYGLGLLQNSIWYFRGWGATMKSVFDAFVYALLSAGAFGWLWPAA